jgi:hypothetical protein
MINSISWSFTRMGGNSRSLRTTIRRLRRTGMEVGKKSARRENESNVRIVPRRSNLQETVHIDNGRSKTPLVIRYVYDVVSSDMQTGPESDPNRPVLTSNDFTVPIAGIATHQGLAWPWQSRLPSGRYRPRPSVLLQVEQKAAAPEEERSPPRRCSHLVARQSRQE